MRMTAAALLFVFNSSHAAFNPTCAEDARTNEHFCFQQSEMREADGIRTAPLYTGGPKEVERTNFTIAANCSTGVLHLKDRRGVSFAGAGPNEGTQVSRLLARRFCETSLPPVKAPKKKNER